MFNILFFVTVISWFGMLYLGVNIIIAFLISFLAQIITASIISKLSFNKWNPF